MAGRAPPERHAIIDAYDRVAPRYDELHGGRVTTRRFRVIEAPLHRLAARAKTLLEVGCGTGRFAGAVSAPRRFGVDLSVAMLKRARPRGLRVAAADVERLPFGDANFDGIVAPKGVFRYLDYGAAFAECLRVLAPGGQLGVHQYGARPWSPRRPLSAAEADSPIHVSDPDELLDPGTAAGLELVRVHFFRSVRLYPYAVPVPRRWPGDRFGTVWNHLVAIFRRPPE